MEGVATLPFDAAMQEAHSRILLAHRAALGTLDAELRSMRAENMRLRAQLAQACVNGGGLRSSKTPSMEAQVAEEVGIADATVPSCSPTAGDASCTSPAVAAAACNEAGPAPPAGGAPPSQPALSRARSSSPTPQGSAPDVVFTRDAVDAPVPALAPENELATEDSPLGREHEILDQEALESSCANVVGEEGADNANFLEVFPPATPASTQNAGTPKCGAASLEVSAASPDLSSSSGGSTRLSGEVVCAEEASERANLERALEAVLALHNWQHLEVTWESGDRWSIAGAPFRLWCGSSGAPPDAGVEDVADFWKTFEILASEDDGESWEPLEEMIRKRRLQKVVRTAPFATSTLEYNPELLNASPAPPRRVGAGGVSGGSGGCGGSCAVSTTPGATVAGGPLSLADLANISSRSQTPPAPRPVPAAQAFALPVPRSSGPELLRAPLRGVLPQQRSMSALNGLAMRTQARLGGSWT